MDYKRCGSGHEQLSDQSEQFSGQHDLSSGDGHEQFSKRYKKFKSPCAQSGERQKSCLSSRHEQFKDSHEQPSDPHGHFRTSYPEQFRTGHEHVPFSERNREPWLSDELHVDWQDLHHDESGLSVALEKITKSNNLKIP